MAERQHLRSQVIDLIRAGPSASSAARTIGVPLTNAKGWAKLFIENNEVSNREIPVRPSISTRKRTPSQTEKLKTTFFLSAFELKMASKAHGSPLTARKHLRLCRPGRVSVACWGGFHTMSQEPYNGFTVGFW